ncbi:MAG: glycosyltransferase family 2 protein [Parachlamydiaceae bacterium]|nr:glycosyltransferase family 2 protein [Parachlamydiaceae bacterium]
MTLHAPSIGVAVITHNSKHHLLNCLPPLLQSPLKPRVLVVNSSSADGTVEMAKQLGAEVLVIPRHEFNHGTTRELARRYLQTDIIGMLTPDAYFVDEMAFGKLIDPLLKNKAEVAYARQIPHTGADFFEAFAREFNYPNQSHLRSLKDISQYGVYTFFCSNSCAAYSSKALDIIGGFSPVLLGEDTVAVAKLLRNGCSIAYVADALVKHSHRYSLIQEFRRNFDIGLARKQYGELLQAPKGDTQRGLDYLQTMFKRLLEDAPFKIPYGFAHIVVKWLGYRLGKSSSQTPLWFKKLISSQDFYWSSKNN